MEHVSRRRDEKRKCVSCWWHPTQYSRRYGAHSMSQGQCAKKGGGVCLCVRREIHPSSSSSGNATHGQSSSSTPPQSCGIFYARHSRRTTTHTCTHVYEPHLPSHKNSYIARRWRYLCRKNLFPHYT